MARQPEGPRHTIGIPEPLWQWATDAASVEQVSTPELTRRALADYLARHHPAH